MRTAVGRRYFVLTANGRLAYFASIDDRARGARRALGAVRLDAASAVQGHGYDSAGLAIIELQVPALSAPFRTRFRDHVDSNGQNGPVVKMVRMVNQQMRSALLRPATARCIALHRWETARKLEATRGLLWPGGV